MDSHNNLDRAAEFCKLVGAADLLAYLGLPGDVTPTDARAKLKARRKYMQGMQGNPKYKQEALYLIKHFSALDAVLSNPASYLDDAMKRAESVHLPILEMTIRGVLAGGSLTPEQEAYLHRNANELGITEGTFEAIMTRLAGEAGIDRPGRPSQIETVPEPLPPAPTGDFYRFLGVSSTATDQELRAAYQQKLREVQSLPPGSDAEEQRVRLNLVWNVLSDRAARTQYDISSTRTGPPARNRERAPGDGTAPPVKTTAVEPSKRPHDPSGDRPPRLEVEGEPVLRLIRRRGPVSHVLTIRNIGDLPMTGEITTSEPWLTVTPSRIDRTEPEQTVTLAVDPHHLGDPPWEAKVYITTMRAGNAEIHVTVAQATPRAAALLIGGGLLIGAAALAGAAFLAFGSSEPPPPSASAKGRLTLNIDPWAQQVTLDGRPVGTGDLVVVEDLPAGPATLAVTHDRFETWSREIEVEGDQSIEVVLEPTDGLDFQPGPDDREVELDGDDQDEALASRRDQIDACLGRGLAAGGSRAGVMSVHIGPRGAPIGLRIVEADPVSAVVEACARRQAAMLTFAPFSGGDYATVRYVYTVHGEADRP